MQMATLEVGYSGFGPVGCHLCCGMYSAYACVVLT